MFSAKFKRTRASGGNGGLWIGDRLNTSPINNSYSNPTLRLIDTTSSKGIFIIPQTDYRTSGVLSDNVEYLMEFIVNNGELTGRITRTSDNTVVYERTVTPPSSISTYKYLALHYWNNADITFTDVIVKPL